MKVAYETTNKLNKHFKITVGNIRYDILICAVYVKVNKYKSTGQHIGSHEGEQVPGRNVASV